MWLLIFCFALFHNQLTSDDPAWKVKVLKNKDHIYVGDEVTVDIFCDYPSKFKPNVLPFFLNQKGLRKFGYFDYLNGQYRIEKKGDISTLQIQVHLVGEGKDTLIYTPGIISFSSPKLERSILLPTVEIFSKMRHPGPVELAPILPLHPELAISLNQQNYLLSFQNEEVLEKENNRNIYSANKRSYAWNVVFGLCVVAGLLVSVPLIVVEFGLMKKRPPPQEKRDLILEISELEKSSDSLSLRWQKLGLLVRDLLSTFLDKDLHGKISQELIDTIKKSTLFLEKDKEYFTEFLIKLDLIEFANHTTSSEEFLEVCRTLTNLAKTMSK